MAPIDRRSFLRLAGLAGLGTLGASLPGRLSAIESWGAAAPLAAAGDYKAVVCLYLDGGLDHLHVVTPYDMTSFNALKALRPEIMSRPRSDYLPLGSGGQDGRELAFHPAMPGFKALYDAKRLTYLSGVGELSRPTTRAEVMSGAYVMGRAAGSHNDGNAYANGLGYEGTQYGWGGLMLDAVSGLNTRKGLASINLFDTIFAAGRMGQRTQVSSAAEADNLMGLGQKPGFGDIGLTETLRGFTITQPRTNLLEDATRSLASHIDSSSAEAKAAFLASDSAVPVFTYPDGTPTYMGRDNDLARQFRSAARLMHQREFLGVKRQIFNLGLRGFDTHGNSEGTLNPLMGTVDRALAYFFQLLDGLGLADQVTVLISTEFGRSLNGNSSGTDHGWGGGWFVAGGAVKGGTVVGRVPIIDKQGPDFHTINSPTLIPGIAPEQVGATIARWFGVGESDLGTIFPRLSAFSTRDLGFLDATVAMAAAEAGASGTTAAPAAAKGGGCGSGGGAGVVGLALGALLALRERRIPDGDGSGSRG